MLYRRCLTITVSESSKQGLVEKLRWLAPVTIVPNGCAAPEGGPPEPGHGDPAIVYAGRLVGHKRIERVVDLAADLHAAWPRLTVHVIGRGPEQGPLTRQVAGKGLCGRVVLHGFLPEERRTRCSPPRGSM